MLVFEVFMSVLESIYIGFGETFMLVLRTFMTPLFMSIFIKIKTDINTYLCWFLTDINSNFSCSVPDLFGGHLIFPNAVELANVELYLAMIGLEVVVIIKQGLWQAIHVDGTVDMQRVRLESLYEITIQKLILREMA